MKSTNFEFLRGRHPKLADHAARIESMVHGSPEQAIDLLRSLAEHLVQEYLKELMYLEKRDVQLYINSERKDGKTRPFGKLIQEVGRWCDSQYKIRLCNDLEELVKHGNKQHQSGFKASEPHAMTLLQTAWRVAGCFAKMREWGELPEKFTEPPRGGEKLEVDLSNWITSIEMPACRPGEFVGREAVFDWIAESLAKNTNRVLLIEGLPGRGKTALLSHFLAEKLPGGIKPFWFFFEDGKASSDPLTWIRLTWIRHLYASFLKRFALSETSNNIYLEDPETLVRRLFNRTVEVCKGQPECRILFVLDAIDEAGPEARDAVKSLLHQSWPDQVQFQGDCTLSHVPSRTLVR